jgi:hypothetical protein
MQDVVVVLTANNESKWSWTKGMNATVMDWLPNPANIHSINHEWALLKYGVTNSTSNQKAVAKMREATAEVSANFTEREIAYIVNSLPACMCAVIG